MIGTIDTSVKPLTFSGDGEIGRCGSGTVRVGPERRMDAGPRYAGTVSGRFQVEGAGTDRESLRIAGERPAETGRDVRRPRHRRRRHVRYSDGTLKTTFNGPFAADRSGSGARRQPLQGLGDRFRERAPHGAGAAPAEPGGGRLRHRGNAGARIVHGPRRRNRGRARRRGVPKRHRDASPSRCRRRRHSTSPAPASFRSTAAVRVPQSVPGVRRDNLDYEVKRADLARLETLIGRGVSGLFSTKGRLTGPIDRPRLRGDGTIAGVKAPDFEALTLTADYDLTLPSRRWQDADGHGPSIRASFLKVFGRPMQEATGTIAIGGRTGDVRRAAWPWTLAARASWPAPPCCTPSGARSRCRTSPSPSAGRRGGWCRRPRRRSSPGTTPGCRWAPWLCQRQRRQRADRRLRHLAQRTATARCASPPRTSRSTRSKARSRCRPDTAARSSSTPRSAGRAPDADRHQPRRDHRRPRSPAGLRAAGRPRRLRRRRPQHRRPARSIARRLAQRRREGAARAVRSRSAGAARSTWRSRRARSASV